MSSKKIRTLLREASESEQNNRTKFIAAHKIELLDFTDKKSELFTSPQKMTRQRTRPADYDTGEDVAAYVGSSEMEAILAAYPVKDLEDYIRRRNNAIPTGQRYVNESITAGDMKLDDGSKVSISKQDATLLDKLLKDLNTTNRKKMSAVMKKDKSGFEEILGFAREAL